jgi:hypothetical protein
MQYSSRKPWKTTKKTIHKLINSLSMKQFFQNIPKKEIEMEESGVHGLPYSW